MKRDEDGSLLTPQYEDGSAQRRLVGSSVPAADPTGLEECFSAINTIVARDAYPCDRMPNAEQVVEAGRNETFHHKQREAISGLVRTFDMLSPKEQTFLVQVFLTRMSHNQHNGLEVFLRAMLRRDFIRTLNGAGLEHISERILSMLDAFSLFQAEQCSTVWQHTVDQSRLWRRLIVQKLEDDFNWRSLAKRRKWGILLGQFPEALPYTEGPSTAYLLQHIPDSIFRQLYCDVVADIKSIHRNWRYGVYTLRKIHCNSTNSKGVYCLQYDDDKIVSGLRDNSIKIWNRKDHSVSKVMVGHTGSVLSLQYEGDVLITGSSDTTIRVWSIESGTSVNMLIHHGEAVLHLRFVGKIMVSSSKDRTIAVWDMKSPTDIVLRRALVGHRAAVNVVDFDSRFIISASGDRTIKMWMTESCEYYRTLSGHRRGIACLQYMGDLIVSGSSDNTIRIWNAISGVCLRTLQGHQELVRCIRFNSQFIVSGAYDGRIKVWDLRAALDPLSGASDFCIRTLAHHTGRVFRLQFDMFQIVSSSHDDTILFFDFCSNQLATGTLRDHHHHHHHHHHQQQQHQEAEEHAHVDSEYAMRRPSMNPLSAKVRHAIDAVIRSMRPVKQATSDTGTNIDEDVEMET